MTLNESQPSITSHRASAQSITSEMIHSTIVHTCRTMRCETIKSNLNIQKRIFEREKKTEIIFHWETFVVYDKKYQQQQQQRHSTTNMPIKVKRSPFEKLLTNICILDDDATVSIMLLMT